jgi:hypothetical protein
MLGAEVRGQHEGLLKVGEAVPQTAVLPVVTWHYMSGCWNFPRIRQKIAGSR